MTFLITLLVAWMVIIGVLAIHFGVVVTANQMFRSRINQVFFVIAGDAIAVWAQVTLGWVILDRMA